MKRGDRIVGDGKELIERLGRKDPCPCGSGRRFQAVLHARDVVSRLQSLAVALLVAARFWRYLIEVSV